MLPEKGGKAQMLLSSICLGILGVLAGAGIIAVGFLGEFPRIVVAVGLLVIGASVTMMLIILILLAEQKTVISELSPPLHKLREFRKESDQLKKGVKL